MRVKTLFSGGGDGRKPALFAGVLLASSCVGAAEPGTSLVLDTPSRVFVQQEMGQYVEGIGQALGALARNDSRAFAEAVRPLGVAGMQAAPASLMQQLPMGFKQQGMQLHQAFDRLAARAGQGAPAFELLEGLSSVMTRCGACHGTYRLEAP